MELYIPEAIRRYTDGIPCKEDSVGCSEDTVLLFGDEYILKISSDPQRLKREMERNDWITSYLPGAKNIQYLQDCGRYYYLRTFVRGDSLISDRFMQNPGMLIETLEGIVANLRSLDDKHCPFRSQDNEGNDFVHGDLCLPNIYVDSHNELAGFIDTENAGTGDRWYDYSWVLWSLQFNLKTDKYNNDLLKKLGLTFDAEKYKRYTTL